MIDNKERQHTFNFKNILAERQMVDMEVSDEINHWPTIRSEMLLSTNYVENILKDCIVCLTRSEYSRKISRDVIASILMDRDVIPEELFEDVKKIFKIRDQYGHSMRLSKIDNEIKPIVLKLNCIRGYQKNYSDWDELSDDEKFEKIIGFLNFCLQGCFEKLVRKENLLKDEEEI